MNILNGMSKLLASIFLNLGKKTIYYPCFGYLDETEIPKELLEEDK